MSSSSTASQDLGVASGGLADSDMTRYRIALLPGDGIGPEVMAAATAVLEALSDHGVTFDLVEMPIGMHALELAGTPLPSETVEVARSADSVLHGATDAGAIPADSVAPLYGLRRALETYAAVRPCVSRPGGPVLHDDVDLVVIRETTEGTYSKIEYLVGEDAACGVRLVTRKASERVGRLAFALAAARPRRHLTVTHKVAGVRLGDRLWLDVIEGLAAEYPSVTLKVANVDAVGMELVRQPTAFDVVLCENANGDILSDVAAGLVGGLGLAASGGYGERGAYFEPVHGSAPDIAGRGVANPMAMFLSVSMMLDHLGEPAAARSVSEAVDDVLRDGSSLTPDLGGCATTEDVTRAVLSKLSGS